MIRIMHAACVLCIAGLSLTPGGHVPSWTASDKLAHMAAYLLLGMLTTAAYKTWKIRSWLLLGAIVMGVGLEFAQDLIPRREMSVLDAMANTAGILIATLLTFIYTRIRTRPRRSST